MLGSDNCKISSFSFQQKPTTSDEFIPKVNNLFTLIFSLELDDAINTELFLRKHSRTGVTTMMARVSH